MAQINLLGVLNTEKGLDAFAVQFFEIIGASQFEERESSNYVDGRYFRGSINEATFTISLADDGGNEDLPFRIFIDSDELDFATLLSTIDEIVRSKNISVNFRFARIRDLGTLDECRIDY